MFFGPLETVYGLWWHSSPFSDEFCCVSVFPTCSVGTVKLLNGAYRGCTAEVKALKIEEFCVVVDITSGPRKGKRLSRVAYEDVSRLVSN